jgi:pimeloyl-ACP methyl ester carboxylesterase
LVKSPNVDTSPVRVPVNGCSAAVWRFGSSTGWPLLWHHGGLVCGLDAALLEDAARRLGAAIYSVDRPGIGYTDWWDVPTMAEWPIAVERVADFFALGDFAVAGWSGGGPYALACAAAMPDRVRVVASVAGMPPLRDRRDVMELGLWADRALILAARRWPHLTSALFGLMRHAPAPYLRSEIRKLCEGPKDQALLEQSLPLLVKAVRLATTHGGRGMVDEYRRYFRDWGFSLSSVHQPVTVWQGDHDAGLPMALARSLAADLPNGELRMVPAAGHALPLVIADDILADLAP